MSLDHQDCYRNLTGNKNENSTTNRKMDMKIETNRRFNRQRPSVKIITRVR